MAKWKKWWLVVPLAGAAALMVLLAIQIVNTIDYRNNDFFTFWLAGHMVTQGGNPYSPAQWVSGHQVFDVTWIPNQAYVYPLPLSLLFAPLGLLPLKQAYITWVALSEVMILVSLVLLLSVRANSRFVRFFIPLFVGLVFFRPTTLTLFNGQISGGLLLLMTGVIFLWERNKWTWGALLLPFLWLKPNIGAPLLALLGIWLLFKKRYRPSLAMAVGSLALLIVGLIQNPHWVTDYWGIGYLKVAQNFGGPPTVWGLGKLVCSNGKVCMAALGGGSSLILILVFLWMTLRFRPGLAPLEVVALAVCVTLLVTPYTWTYDQLLLLIPTAALVLAMEHRKVSFLLTSSLFIGIDLLVLVLLAFNTILQVEILNAIVPAVLLGLCLWIFSRPLPPHPEVERKGLESKPSS